MIYTAVTASCEVVASTDRRAVCGIFQMWTVAEVTCTVICCYLVRVWIGVNLLGLGARWRRIDRGEMRGTPGGGSKIGKDPAVRGERGVCFCAVYDGI